mmetsp:Transcript_12018/g.23073  ORF Transcript_12018/g.23073 Transcript_12018/m.23073 type:complete len:454 (-) Transcript_12018:133-1494(-)
MTVKMGLRTNADFFFACLPLIPPGVLLVSLIGNPIPVVQRWATHRKQNASDAAPPVASQLLAYLFVAVLGYMVTYRLVPSIKQYTLRKGISGKDLGKKGTSIADKDIPEALGIVSGAVFLVCLIFCLVGYAHSNPSKLLDVNSALLSICFMLFLGFTDDVLDWPWRYKLILPSVGSLPLLCCYEGSTSIVVPIQLRPLLWKNGTATVLGNLLNCIMVIDAQADGKVIETGYWYLLYMGMLAVFCTNAINIYAGINGLEAGQSFVIGCAVLVHNLWEIQSDNLTTNHLFSAMLMLSFVGVTLGLLQHNWFPASVFVGDTFCYFSGMTFAVVGILGHFSKTLLLFFIPQIVNFLWSCPQLFKLVPCPRHRLPRLDPKTGLMQASTFPCGAHEYRWLKRKPDNTECPNMTLISLCLQFLGPMRERDLCVVLLSLQVISCAAGLLCRYFLAQFFFEN